MRRRDALVFGAVVATAIAIPPILRRIPSDFEFEPLEGFPGFRRIAGGSVSGGVDPFFGLSDRIPDQAALTSINPISPCSALFGPQGWGPDTVPIAIFSDFNCPYCKVLERRLMDLRDAGAPVRLVWHEMPLLGPSSRRAARAVLAARYLGAEPQARAYLTNANLRPGPAALRRMAQELDLLPDMLAREYNGARVAGALTNSLALGMRLGIPGTPGTMIGRTLVIGAIKQADLKRLIEIEQSEPQTVCS